MKPIFILSTALMISLSGWAQISTDTTFQYEWNPNTEIWSLFNRTINTYNQDNKISELVQVMYDNRWENYSFRAYRYDNDHLLTEEFEQFWNDAALMWEDNYRLSYYYDESQHLRELLHQNIYDGNIRNSLREFISYYPDGLQKEKIVQQYSEKGWEYFSRNTYSYAGNLLSREVISNWVDEAWEPAFQYEYAYNIQGQIIERTKSRLTGAEVDPITRHEYIINRNNHLEQILSFRWNSRKKQWEETSRDLFSSDPTGDIRTSIYQLALRKGWANYLFSEYPQNYHFDLTQPVETDCSFFIQTDPLRRMAVLQFENPENEMFIVRIIHESGKLVKSTVTSSNEVKIDKEKLTAGLYYVELQGNSLFSGKFSVE
ncbi:MAG: hypothetical protein JW861_09170 [Bacteroidales bacterium]|nr:hypothetical protein [Bacteroidales bacterium]